VKKNGQLVGTYAYDGLGLRVSATTTITSKTTGQSKTTTRDYVFDLADRVIYDKVISTSGQLPANEDPETATDNSYVFANGAHFAKVEGVIGTTAEVYFYHNDHLGSPMAITDSQGNLAWSQDYLPYGEALNEAATQTKTRFTFTGKELDPATGLYYYNARWYDPDLGRFMTEDTYAGDPNNPRTLNRYVYVAGNPLRYTDPTGHKLAVGSSMDDEDDTEEGQHVWTGNNDYDNAHAQANMDRERAEGVTKSPAPQPPTPNTPSMSSLPGYAPVVSVPGATAPFTRIPSWPSAPPKA
jgi:RHS repeat-associated protein